MTNLFTVSRFDQKEIKNSQNWLTTFITAYALMSLFNGILFVVQIFTNVPFWTVAAEMIANFLFDICTIGVTLYLNLSATRDRRAQLEHREKLQRVVS